MNGLSTVLIVVGLFFAGGVYSFAKQGKPKGPIVVLGLAAVLALAAGLLRVDW
ncbi:hypothetical protein SRB5_60570 [Streptomyces sp. RB5]|uniref:Amidotransferase n=1 Tax=Streptomyces smaragdinus TaxID=2585196 RepID=A0A7K0CQV2_9ACTN|nr:hypothetical protein [Streptomyces smaragdinus]MQY15865.1 hypothetical protein [Streptomyces smaragdinus]